MFSLFHIPIVTKNLLIINIIVYFSTYILRQNNQVDLNDYLSLHDHLSSNFKPHQWVTYIFMHADGRHLFSNMLGILIFGSMLEGHWGPKRFLIFYMICGLGAAIPQYIINHIMVLDEIRIKDAIMLDPDYKPVQKEIYMNAFYNGLNKFVTLGASGALYGILGGAFAIFGNVPMSLFFLPISFPLKYLVTVYMVMEIIGGLGSGDGVAHFAHIGGLIVGMIMVLIWERNWKS
jgi:membrane associated rhomboid family serine protease